MRIDEAVAYIESNLPPEFQTLKMNVMTRRKLIKTVISLHLIFVANLLINKTPYTFRFIGKLIPYNRKIGSGKNPFTGLARDSKTIPSIKFKISKKLKELLKA